MTNSRASTRLNGGDELARLGSDLQRLADLLDHHGEEHWCRWARESLAEIQRHDLRGLNRLRRAYGGMGSFNDLVLDGDGFENRSRVNAELDALRSRIYSDLTALLALDDDSGLGAVR